MIHGPEPLTPEELARLAELQQQASAGPWSHSLASGQFDREQFVRRMREIFAATPGDPETAHSKADALMCGVLRSLGYGEGVDVFEQAAKWYS